MKIMGLDYGAKTVGVAMTDELLMTVQNVETIEREQEKKLRRTLARIEELVRRNDVSKIVLGLPLTMEDQMGERAQKTLYFKSLLEKRVNIPVILHNEQLTTRAADEILDEMGIDHRDRKKVIDQIAANIILTDFLSNEYKQKECEEAQ